MKRTSIQAAKLLSILLFLLVFLTPVITAYASCDSPPGMNNQSASHFDKKREEKPVPFLAEGSDTEEEQREDQLERTSTLFAAEVIGTAYSQVCGRKFILAVKAYKDNQYNMQPPLFRLYCLLLI